MSTHNPQLSIGELADRTGLSLSAIRFYESKGLVSAQRTPGGQRRFVRSDIRRLSFVLITQKLGSSLVEIGEQLARLPQGRTPSRRDWERLAHSFRQVLDERLRGLESLRDRLTSCIGCGCLSLRVCRIYNPDDEAAERGSGPRYLLGDSSH